ncbi:MAG TPA: ferrous iron transport protein A [Epsilonproteobacteria bacterium]|nr:ferrous iron transport protein A [Campylobacterota bacterium]
MLLNQLDAGEDAVIDAIHVGGALKARLSSLGITKNEAVSVERYSLFGSTVQVRTASSFIALRRDEATCIEVHKLR